MSSASTEPTVRVGDPVIRRAVTAASVGNFVEWFDFGFYGYLAATLSTVFFPSDNPTSGLLATFAVFGAAFVVRPLGATYFGAIGDRLGRNRVLAITVLMMSIATFVVGLLPGYASIGVLAPVLLLVLRLVQGFAAGGEPGGAATFLAEYSPDRHRGAIVSFWHVSSFLALIASSGLALLLYAVTTDAQMLAWGWRIPFLAALPAGFIGLYIRLRIEDTPAFRSLENAGEKARTPLRDVIHYDLRRIVRVFLLAAVQQFAFYTIFVYIAIYMRTQAGYSSTDGTAATLVAVASALIVVAPAGALSDRIGRKRVLIASCVLLAILAWPMLSLINNHRLALAVIAAVGLSIPLAGFMGAAAATFPEAFPTRRRYAGMSFAFGIAAAVFGGTAPYLSTWAIDRIGDPLAPAYLLIGTAIISLIAACTLRETAGKPLTTD
ncbi:MFS transporter [Kribbella sp. NPDC050124]|uniref:MFS transporter n=1 Tax=Kribbella sp. NPDC050124 TaxID=3364114 RepID=UPI0037AF3346